MNKQFVSLYINVCFNTNNWPLSKYKEIDLQIQFFELAVESAIFEFQKDL